MKGSVIAKDSQAITIALSHSKEDGCKACGLGESCSLPKSQTIRVERKFVKEDYQINEIVDVEMSSRKFLWLSASVYILPVITLIAGGIFGSRYSEILSIILSLTGLVAGIMFNLILDKVLSVHDVVDVRRAR